MKRGRDHVSDKYNENKRINEEIEDMTSTKSKIKDLIDRGVIDRVERGLPVSHKDFKELEGIKRDHEAYFDEESDNTLKGGLSEVAEYLEEEIASLSKSRPSQGLNRPLEYEYKKRKIDDSTDNKPSSSNTEDKPSSSSTDNKSSSSSTDLPVEMPSIFDDTD